MVGCIDARTSVNCHTDIQKSFSRVTENLCRSSYDPIETVNDDQHINLPGWRREAGRHIRCDGFKNNG